MLWPHEGQVRVRTSVGFVSSSVTRVLSLLVPGITVDVISSMPLS